LANNNSKLSRSIETLNFLKEYAQDPNRNFEDVAQKLGISEQNAENYLRKYIYLVKNTKIETFQDVLD
jgi:predicted solute-binding protein